jgi:hypothetical protein
MYGGSKEVKRRWARRARNRARRGMKYKQEVKDDEEVGK